MGLKIDQTWAKIGIDSSFSTVKLAKKEPFLHLEQTFLKVKLEQDYPKTKLDSSRCWEEVGYKNPLDFSREYAQKGREACLKYTGKVAERGDMMGAINKYNISQCNVRYAREAWHSLDYNVARIPRSLVDVEVIPANLDINWQMGKSKVDLERGKIQIDDVKGAIDIYLRQKGHIQIQFQEEKKVDMYQ